MIANSSPQLGWLAPQAVHFAQTAPDVIAPVAPSSDLEQLKAMSLGLAAMRQSIEQLAAGQERMTQDITKLQAAEEKASMSGSTFDGVAAARSGNVTRRSILHKISTPPPRPAAAPAYKPAPLTPPQPAPPVR
jgi:hypothetical protein